MIRKTSCPGFAEKSRWTRFPAILIFLLLTSLVFCGGEAAAVTWQDQGPSPLHQGAVVIPPDNPTTGAIQSVVIDPNDNNIMYIGAVNGGIWKTTNDGNTWTPLTDNLISLSMGGMALDPGNSSRILAGFGQFSNAIQGGPLAGVILSNDGGNTWTPVGGAVTANTNVSSVVLNGQVMFVASRSSVHPNSPDLSTPVTGLFRSTDGGTSFIQISGSGGLPLGSVTSLVSDPSDPNRLYAALQNSGIFRSDDQGKTWTNITPAGSGIGAGTRYIQLSVGAGGKSLFMALTAGGEKSTVLQSVWRSLDRGATWQNMGGQGAGPGQGLPGTIENGQFIGINSDGQGEINFTLGADPNPTNPNIVYIGGDAQPGPFPNQIGAIRTNSSLFRGDASQALSSPPAVDSWTPATPYNGQWLPITDNFANGTTTHADSRAMAFDASGNLLETNDGGVYRRINPQSGTDQWTSLVGNLQVTEMLGISYDSNTHTLISGNQDNGAGGQDQTNGKIWTLKLLADGGQTAVNDQDPAFSVRYMSSQRLGEFTRLKVDPQNNSITQEVKGTKLQVILEDGSTVPLEKYENNHGSSIPFEAPVRVNQADKTQLAIGTKIVYLATDNAQNGLTPYLLLTPINTTTFEESVGDIAYLAPNQPGKTNLLLAAEGKNLWLSTTLLKDSLKKLDKYPTANGPITSVCINPNFTDTNLANYRFYVADGSCVRSTDDGGTSWTTGLSLPQLRSLQFVSKGLNNFLVAGGYGTLYAARENDLNDWYSLKGNLPNTFVWQIDYSSRDDTLAVGTLGRGAFTVANASTLIPAFLPLSVDTDWIRLLRANPVDQTLNGGTVQNPDSVNLGMMNLTLTSLGGIFDTTGPDADHGTNSTLTGLISGPGILSIVGNGILSLRHDNTYGGGTILNGGTVNVERDANLGLAGGSLTFNGGTLQTAADFNSGRGITLLPYGGTFDTSTSTSALTLGGIISGPGTLTKMGAGILTLSGINTYSGGTILSGGTLRVARDDNLGAAGGPITFNGGTLQAAGALTSSRTLVVLGSPLVPLVTFDTGTFASVFSGELFGFGTFTQTGTGSLTLNGDGSPFAGTYALLGGALTLNNVLGSTLAPSTLMVNPGTTFSGNGNLVGSLNLQGDGAGFAGSVEVASASTFTLNNTLGGTPTPCSVLVDPGGLMTGSGTLVGTLTNRGTISPGNSPGTVNVVGSFTQAPSGTYIAEIASPGSYDRIAVTGNPGTANLAGTLSPVFLGGYRPPGNTVFPGVVTATGGINGTFSSITNQMLSPTLFWQPRYSANSFDLVVQRDYANPGLNLNSNQLTVGTMLNSVAGATSGDLNTVLNTIDSLPAAAPVQEAYKQISPEKAGALVNLGFVAANFQARNLATRTTNLRFVQGGSGMASNLAPGGVSCNYSRQSGVMLAYNGGFLPDLFTARREFKAPESRWGLFADGGAAFGTQSSTSNQTGYNFTLGGLTLGADYRVTDKLLMGLATGYSNTASSFYGTGGSVTVNTIPFNAYAAYFSGPLYAYGSLGYALNLYNLRRAINFDGIGRTATSSITGSQFNLYGEAGYDLKFSRMILTPAATLSYSALWLGGFTEQNAGALNLKVGPQNASSVQTGVGGRITLPLKMGSIIVVPQAYAFYQHEFANGSRGLTASLSQGSSSFIWQTDAAGQNFALVGASLTAGLRDNLFAQVNFNAEVGRKNATAQFINAGLRYEF